MHLSPQAFLEKYERDQNPYFRIRKGMASTSKTFLHKFNKSLHGATGYDLMNEGREELVNFFNSYPDGGLVTIETFGSKNTQSDYNIFATVKWGAGSASSSGSMKLSGTGYQSQGNDMLSGQGGMMQMMQLFSFFQNLQAPQQKLLEKQMELQYELKRKEDELKRMEQEEPMSTGEALAHELIGLINPMAMAMMKGKPVQPQNAAIAGTGAASPKEDPKEPQEEDSEEETYKQNPPPQRAAQRGIDINNLVRNSMTIANLFPGYHVNDVMHIITEFMVNNLLMVKEKFIAELEKLKTQG